MSKFLSDLKQIEETHFQEELAKTYFSSTPSKENDSTQAIFKNKKNKGLIIKTIFGILALLLIGLLMLSKIEIAIKVTPSFKTTLVAENKHRQAIYLNKNGELNTDIVKNVIFYENSNKESNWGRDFILLSNEVAAKKAVLGIDFTGPLNLQDSLIFFHSKGREGGEDLRVSLRDNKNNLCYSTINGLKGLWQQFVVNLEGAKNLIDLENVMHIDLEVNPNEKQNTNCSAIYLKDIYITKKEGLKQ